MICENCGMLTIPFNDGTCEFCGEFVIKKDDEQHPASPSEAEK